MIESGLSVKLLFTVSVPLAVVPVPPKIAPKFTVTAPPTVPVPPNTVFSLSLLSTMTAPVAPVELPLINNVPPSTVVPPS
jgi:hypothetical protein